jgi:predicted ATP-dependent serine protease
LRSGNLSQLNQQPEIDEATAERKAIQAESREAEKKKPPSKVRACTLENLIKKYSADVCYIWREHIPRGMPVMLAADEGMGKTFTALSQAKEILADYPDKKVLWLAVEGSISNTINHAVKLGLSENNRFVIGARLENDQEFYNFNFATKEHCKRLNELLLDSDYICAFVDSVRGLSEESVNDEKSASIMRRVNRIVCDKFNCAIEYLHHTNKKEGATRRNTITGSAGLQAAVRAVYLLSKKSKYSRLIDPVKSNICLETPRLITAMMGDRLEIYPEIEQELSDISRAESFLMALFKDQTEIPSTTIYQMAEAENINPSTVKEAKNKIPGLISKRIDNQWHYVFLGARDIFP